MARWREYNVNTVIDHTMNGTHPHGRPNPQDKSRTIGFTAVNGEVRRPASQTSTDDNASSLTAMEDDTIRVATASRPETLRDNALQDAEPQPQRPVERRPSDSSAGNKRKRSDSQDRASLRDPMRLDTINTGANGSQSPMRRHLQTIADSAIDLTSPNNDPPNPMQRDSASASEPKPLTPQARDTSPAPWRPQLEPPPRPTAETEASLAESVLKFQQNRQASENKQSQSQSGSIGQAGSPEDEEDDDPDGQDQGDDAMQGDNSDSKKRKRNFSNRTKTGCHTCRGRKKKCDEAKPRCNNCERGGFECLGYGPKQPALKMHLQARGMPTLQAKSYEGPPGPAMFYPQHPQPLYPPQQHPDDSQHYRNLSLPHADQDHARRSFDAPQPQRPGSQSGRNEWPGTPWPPHGQTMPPNQPPLPIPPPPAFSPDRVPQPPQASPLSSYSQHQPHPSHPPQPSHLQHPPPPPPPPPPFPSYSAPYPPPERQPAVPIQPPVQDRDPWNPMRYSFPPPPATVGSSRESVGSRSSHSSLPFIGLPGNHPTEREKMMTGKPHQYYVDRELVSDRKECRKSLARYNHAALEKRDGQEMSRLFRQVLRPRERPVEDARDCQHFMPETLNGSIEPDTIVEPPFTCDFGYGLHFGRKTNVERDCYFQDAGGIHIGNEVTIQAKVQLITLTVSVDPKGRGGSYGAYKAGMINIEDNAFLGHGSIIYPYVTIGKNAYVWPGSVVTKDVKEGWEVAGNPAQRVHFSDDLQAQEDKTIKRMEELADTRKKQRDETKNPTYAEQRPSVETSRRPPYEPGARYS